MVNPSNDDLGQGKDNPQGDDAKEHLAPKEEAERKDKRDELADEEFDRAVRRLFDFSRRDPWEQEHAPPVNRELVRRFVRDELSAEEDKQVIHLLSRWENWHNAESQEMHAYFAEQTRERELSPPVDQDLVRRFARWYYLDEEGQISDVEKDHVRDMTSRWEKWADAEEDEYSQCDEELRNRSADLRKQENALPVDRDLVYRYMRWYYCANAESLSQEDVRRARKLIARWDNWAQAAREAFEAVADE